MKWFALGIGYVLTTIFGGWVLTVLWGWFVVLTFGLPSLSIPIAIGINLVAVVLTINAQPHKDKDKALFDSLAESLCFVVVYRTLFLISGWILHTWFV